MNRGFTDYYRNAEMLRSVDDNATRQNLLADVYRPFSSFLIPGLFGPRKRTSLSNNHQRHDHERHAERSVTRSGKSTKKLSEVQGTSNKIEAIKKAVEVEVNHQRAKYGLKALKHDDKQEKLAEKNSDLMVARGLGHYLRAWGWENAAMMPWSKNQSAEQIAKILVGKMWMKSPAHRANILAKNAKTFGVGIEGKYQTLRLG